MKPQIQVQIFETFLSTIPNRKISLQAEIIKKIENSWYFSYIFAKTKYYQKKADKQKNFVIKV